ncbi:MAG: hypothetical protein IKC38_01320 [Clostridia bacterium]|nr:hypothetical protein [Clostridia bacterium]
MRRTEVFEMLSRLLQFKTIKDSQGNEYVLFAENKLSDPIEGIEDRTAFEAVENHIHILKDIKRKEFDKLGSSAKAVGEVVFNKLQLTCPDKKFVVYVSLKLGDSMIVRFHQVWDGEEPYYDVTSFNSNRQKMYCFY